MDRREWLLSSVAAVVAASSTKAGEHSLPIHSLAVSPDGRNLVTGSQAGLGIHSLPSLRRQRRVETRLDQITRLCFVEEGRILIVAGGIPAESGVVLRWSWPECRLLGSWSDHRDVVWDVDWDDGWLGTASLDRQVVLHQPKADRPHVLTGHSRGVTGFAWLLPGQQCVTCSLDHSIRLWQREGDVWKVTLVMNQHRGPVLQLARRPMEEGAGLPQLMTCSQDKTVRLWQPTIGRMVRFARFASTTPVAGTWTPEGRWFAVACDDGRVRWIDPDSAEVVQSKSVGSRPLTAIAAIAGSNPSVVVADDHGHLAVVERPAAGSASGG